MWIRWAISLTVAAAALAALVWFVDNHNTITLAKQSPAALARANREADILTAQDQSPHVVRPAPAARPLQAAAAAVRADMSGRVQRGLIAGPLQHIACRPTGHRGSTLGFACAATSAHVNYDYTGVIQARHRLVYCRRDPPPVPGEPIPLSHRCLP